MAVVHLCSHANEHQQSLCGTQGGHRMHRLSIGTHCQVKSLQGKNSPGHMDGMMKLQVEKLASQRT